MAAFMCLYFKLANMFWKGCNIMWKHHKGQSLSLSLSLFLSFMKRGVFKLWVFKQMQDRGHFWNERFCPSSYRKLNPFAGKWKQHFINLLSNSIVVKSSFRIVICSGIHPVSATSDPDQIISVCFTFLSCKMGLKMIPPH